ncbi:MAG: hypothetical protein RL235_1166 [Chlamydiota bacterium]|jgi:hypothetical protein
MRTKITALLLFATTSLFAVLSPLAQSAREIDTILSDTRLYDVIGSGEAIVQIIKTEGGYVLLTPQHIVKVDVLYLPSHRVGPIEFKIEFHPAIN